MLAELDPLYIKTRPSAAIRRLVTHACFQGRQPSMRWLWLNHFYDRFIRAVMKVHPAPRQVEKPIFILGVGRSGTTILGKLLSFHRAVGFLNEPKAIWHVIYPDEDVLGTYPVTQRKYWLVTEDASPTVCARARRVYGTYLSFVHARRVVDKFPEGIYRIPFLLAVFKDAKFVVIVRNGVDTVRSIADYARANTRQYPDRRENWWGVNDQKWHLLVEQVAVRDAAFAVRIDELSNLTRPEDRAAVEWSLAIRETQRWLLALPPQTIHLVRYERLVAEPRQTLQELLTFCELSEDPELLHYAHQVLRQRRHPARLSLTPWVEDVFRQAMSAQGYMFG